MPERAATGCRHSLSPCRGSDPRAGGGEGGRRPNLQVAPSINNLHKIPLDAAVNGLPASLVPAKFQVVFGRGTDSVCHILKGIGWDGAIQLGILQWGLAPK